MNWLDLPLPEKMLRVNALRRERERLEAQDREYRRRLAIQQEEERLVREARQTQAHEAAMAKYHAKLRAEVEACNKKKGSPCTAEEVRREERLARLHL